MPEIKEIVFDGKELNVYCETFIWEPSTIDEEKLGYLFIVGRIKNAPETSFYILNLLASRIKREYFSNPNRSQGLAFSQALKAGTNIILENRDRINWPLSLDILVASISGNKILISQIGKMKAFLLRKNEVIDLSENLEGSYTPTNPFSAILKGEMKKNDALIFSTSNVFNKKFLIEHGNEIFPLSKEKGQLFLEKKEIDESGIALFIEMGKEVISLEKIVEEKEAKVKIFSQDSKKELMKISEKIKYNFSKIPKIFQDFWTKTSNSLKKHIERNKNIPQKEMPTSQIVSSQRSLISTKNFFYKRQNVLMILGIILLILIIGLSVWQNNQKQKIAEINQTFEEINKTIQEGENFLIFSKKQESIEKFNEALKKLDEIKPLTSEQKTKKENFKNTAESKLNEILGRKIIDNPQIIFEMQDLPENFEPTNIIKNNSEISILAKNSPYVYKIDLKYNKGKITNISEILDQENIKIIQATKIQNRNIYLILVDKNYKIYIEGKNFPIPISISQSDNADIIDVDNYSNFMYLFDKSQGQLYKYQIFENSISSPTKWLKETKSNVKNLAIDGDVYFLLENGKLEIYSLGNKKGEIELQIFPTPKTISQIFTSRNHKYLYFLVDNNRLVLTEKSGVQVKEYILKDIEKINDLFVEENDGTIYIIATNKIIKIDQNQ